jgi:hypothetical protein
MVQAGSPSETPLLQGPFVPTTRQPRKWHLDGTSSSATPACAWDGSSGSRCSRRCLGGSWQSPHYERRPWSTVLQVTVSSTEVCVSQTPSGLCLSAPTCERAGFLPPWTSMHPAKVARRLASTGSFAS